MFCLGFEHPGQVDAHPHQDLVAVDRDVPVAEPQRRALLRDRQSVEDLHASSGGVSSVTSKKDQSLSIVPHGGIPSGSAFKLPDVELPVLEPPAEAFLIGVDTPTA